MIPDTVTSYGYTFYQCGETLKNMNLTICPNGMRFTVSGVTLRNLHLKNMSNSHLLYVFTDNCKVVESVTGVDTRHLTNACSTNSGYLEFQCPNMQFVDGNYIAYASGCVHNVGTGTPKMNRYWNA